MAAMHKSKLHKKYFALHESVCETEFNALRSMCEVTTACSVHC